MTGEEGDYGVIRPSAQSDSDDYEEQWEQLDEKVLLVQILMQLEEANTHLQELTGGEQVQEEATPMYDCQRCTKTVKEEDRQQHAESQHNAPPYSWKSLFTPAE